LDQPVIACAILHAILVGGSIKRYHFGSIGPNWLAVNPETQRPRLEDETDWVRIEISTALARPDVLVIPVAVDGASIPRPEQLPQDLKNLAFRSGFVFKNDDFSRNLERLVEFLGGPEPGTNHPRPVKVGDGPSEDRRINRSRHFITALALFSALAAFVATGRQLWEVGAELIFKHGGTSTTKDAPVTQQKQRANAETIVPEAAKTPSLTGTPNDSPTIHMST
jgi:hypothetical protein